MKKTCCPYIWLALQLLVVAISQQGFCASSGQVANEPNDLNRLTLAAIPDSTIEPIRPLVVALELRIDRPLSEAQRSLLFSTDYAPARVTLHATSQLSSRHQSFDLRASSYLKGGPGVFSLDTLERSIHLGSVSFNVFERSFIGVEALWCYVELTIPKADTGYWFGTLTTDPFLVEVTSPGTPLDTLHIAVPDSLVLVGTRHGTRTSYSLELLSSDTVAVAFDRQWELSSTIRYSLNGGGTALSSGSMDKDKSVHEVFHLPYALQPMDFSVFEDGTRLITIHVDIVASVQKMEWLHGPVYHGPRYSIFSKACSVVVIKDSPVRVSRASTAEWIKRPYLAPRTVELALDNKVVFDKHRMSPMEFEIPKGHRLGYTIWTREQGIRSHVGYPTSPLIELARIPTPQSPVLFAVGVRHFPDSLDVDDTTWLAHSRQVWQVGCTLTTPGSSFVLDSLDERHTLISDHWRSIQMPRSLDLSADGHLAFNADDMITIEHRAAIDRPCIVRLTIDGQVTRRLPTNLPNPLVRSLVIDGSGDLVFVTLELVCVPAGELTSTPDRRRSWLLWSRKYPVVCCDTTALDRRGNDQ